MRRVRRELLRLISPRQHTLFKLLIVILLSTLLLLSYTELQIKSIPMSLDVSVKRRETEIKIRSDKVVENNVLQTAIPLSMISSTDLEHKQFLSLPISTISKEVVAMATTIPSDEMEKSRSRLHISKNGVLSPRTIHIKPTKPVVKEGDSLFLTCATFDARAHHNDDAPYLNFELPEMSHLLENQIHISFITNMAVLKIGVVKKGHEGVYKCVSQNFANEIKYNSVEVRVLETVNKDLVKDDEVKRKHEMYLKKHSHEDNDVVSELLERGKVYGISLVAKTAKEQQVSVDQFCEHHNMSHQALRLPEGEENVTSCLYRHLLLNDKTGTLFCFVPKVGCTNLKLLFFVAIGLVPRSQLQASRDEVDQVMLEGAQFANSFISRSNTQRNFALNHYFKFMMYRNPLERLLSGYRSKVERFPLTGLEDDEPHYNWLRKAIYQSTHPAIYQQYLLSGGVSPVNISFSDFVDYWLTKPESLEIDEHFRSIFSLCEPCRTRYSFYGNFKNFSTDSQVLIKKIHTTPQFLRSGYYNRDSSTGAHTQRYYRQLSSAQKMNIVELLKLDLDFYHHLFPGEESINQSILS